jgi:hypothetical protein
LQLAREDNRVAELDSGDYDDHRTFKKWAIWSPYMFGAAADLAHGFTSIGLPDNA